MSERNRRKGGAGSTGGRAIVALYGGTIFVSAFLLFQVQPIVAKYILPWYGGSQAVWTTCLLFFQSALLLGYLYAHLLRKIGNRKIETVVHCVLLALSLLLLPIVPSGEWRATVVSDPTWRILGLLAVTLGLPYMLLSSTSPLVQSWYPKAFGMATYRLYAVSNLGSLLGLLTYPFLFEPMLTRTAQAAAWSWGMGAFALLAGLSAVVSLRYAKTRDDEKQTGRPAGGAEDSGLASKPTDMRDPIRTIFWILLPALASVLLLSTTNKLVQELVAIPFLWIVPLTIYLLSFILTFDSSRWYRREVFLGLLALSFAGVLYFLMVKEDPSLSLSIGFYAAALFAGCMVCHGELARLKPAPRRLTAFYLCIAAGGAIGGLFVAVIAPAVFNDFTEYPLALALIPAAWLAVRRYAPAGPKEKPLPGRAAAGGAAAVVLFAAGLIGAGDRPHVIAGERNFYGTLAVAEYGPRETEVWHRTMRHGNILHGLQYLDPKRERIPTSYFSAHGGAGILLANYPRIPGKGLNLGVVGLGVGTLAAWTRPGDTMTFYEINPAVERLARKYFTFLGKAEGEVTVETGDGRLLLEREAPRNYDVLILDAFNNDSPPLHLLTKESFAIYLKHLKPEGAIAVNITSKYINFAPVIEELAANFGLPWTTIVDYNREDTFERSLSYWAILTRIPELHKSEALMASSVQPVIAQRLPLWTDDYTSLFGIVEW
jgi:MFS family permease